MIGTGLMAKWLEQYGPKNLCAAQDNIMGGQVATLKDIHGSLIFLSIGISVAIVLFVGEIYYKKRKEKKETENVEISTKL